MLFNERSEIKLASWNIHAALSDPDRVTQTVENILDNSGTVVSLQDAYRLDSIDSKPSDRQLEVSLDVFRDAGYEVVDTKHQEVRPYNYDNFPEYHFLTLIKAGIYRRREILKTGIRKIVTVDVPMQDKITRVVSVYLSDQNERNRLLQIEAIKLGLIPGMPTALIGDLNAMHGDLIRSKVLRAHMVRTATAEGNPKGGALPRLADMARGGVIREFANIGLLDADTDRQPTMPSRYPLFQIDHILVNDSLIATDFKVDFHPDLSNHGMLTSTIMLSSDNDRAS